MSRVLLTGGSGFLGSHIADALLDAGHAVTIFDRRESPWRRPEQAFVAGDITDADAVRQAMAGHDAVIHLAALADLNAGRDRPVDTLRINVGGTLNVLEAMRVHGIERLLFASTVYVYSREGGFYRCSKQACESYIEEYRQRYGIAHTILRYGSLYGPRADASNGVYRLLRQALRGETVRHAGSPQDVREYIHVVDAARLSVRALDPAWIGENVVITGRDAYRIQDLFTMFSEILGRPLDVEYGEAEAARQPGEATGHYSMTPYAYTPKPGRKLTSDDYVDMGQGLLEVIVDIDQGARPES